MKSYKAKFVKSNGSLREMNFVKIEDLPTSFLKSKISPDAKDKKFQEGNELVWDLDRSDFRVFNWNRKVGNASEKEVSEKVLVS